MRVLRFSLLFFLFTLAFSGDLFAGTEGEDAEIRFLEGSYILIGKRIDSEISYTGRIRFVYNEKTGALDFTRTIAGRRTTGSARIERALAGEAKVLRLRFSENGVLFEGTFLWRSDLDNFARLSGYIYRTGSPAQKPGLEAYFIDSSPPEGS